MKRIGLALFLSLFLLTVAARSQTNSDVSDMPYAGAPCTADGGIKASSDQIAAFGRFDAALRSAVKRNDTAALAFLVRFPLRVNTGSGRLLIPDARSLDGHYFQIFSPGVRNQVLSSGPGDYICRYDEGVGYKRGVIWVSTNGHKFGLDAVNAPDLHAKSYKPTLVYTCETKTHRISIQDPKSGKYRYRSWNKPKELSEPPDLEISNGNLHFEGTGICSYGVYSFRKGNAEYTIDQGLGCSDGSEPKNATGDLHVTVAGKDVTQAWCF
jgi:hypothetical protein